MKKHIRIARHLLVGLCLVGFTTAAEAHDYWLLLSRFHAEPGDLVEVGHRVGERLIGDPVPRNPKLLLRFDHIDSKGRVSPVAGAAGVDPAGLLRAGSAGTEWIVYESDLSFVNVPPPKVFVYAEQEGVDHLIAERERRGETDWPAREAFSRSAKAALCTGSSGGSATSPRAYGLEVELVPESDPCGFRVGDTVRFQLLSEGRPEAGVLVQALDEGHADKPQRARSDDEGFVEFVLGDAGVWLVKAVRLVRTEEIPNIEWQSSWASLTFEVIARGSGVTE